MGDAERPDRARWHGVDRAEVDARWHDVGFRDPADSVVGTDDLGIGQTTVGELLRGLPADVRADEMEDRFPARRFQDRELRALWHQCQPEVEVKDVGTREQPRERAKLRGLAPPGRPARQPQVLVCLRVLQAGVEDNEPRIHAFAPQRLHVRPADAREVDRAVNYSESHSTWSKYRSALRVGRTRAA